MVSRQRCKKKSVLASVHCGRNLINNAPHFFKWKIPNEGKRRSAAISSKQFMVTVAFVHSKKFSFGFG